MKFTTEGRTFFPLRGPGADRPKAPAVDGWQSPAYKSIDQPGSGIWLGMRCDTLVVVDCDNRDALKAWVKRVGKENATTFMRKSPRGFHFIYRWTPGSPETQRLGIFPKTDIKAGFGSYIVWDAPGYGSIDCDVPVRDFVPGWLPTQNLATGEAEEWSEMPEGRGNSTMFSFASTMRRQGMSEDTIAEVLHEINRITMTTDPMPDDMIESLARSASRYEPDPDFDLVFGDDGENEIDTETGEIPDQDARVFMDVRYMRKRPHPGWWWQPYLPKASLVIVEGEESVGKTMFAAYAATQIAMGLPFPEMDESVHPQNVMWFATEDDPYTEILPRFLAAGYEQDDPSAGRILVFNPLFWEREPRFPKSSDSLQRLIEQHNVGLVVFDPGRDYLAPEDGAEASNNNERAVRPGLRALNRIAQQTGATILGGHHQNKRGGDATTRERSTGTVAFRQVPRQVNTMEKVGTLRAMSVEKANGFDHEFTVASYRIDSVGDEKESTGLFVPGIALRDYRSLNEWRKKMEELEAEVEDHINFGVEWTDVAEQYGTLDTGALAPTIDNLMNDVGLTEEQAKSVRHELREHGYITANNRWCKVP